MNETRFKNCILPLHKTLYAYALSILRDESDAEDCLQEAMSRLWENRARLKKVENVAAYATVTVKNIAISMANRSRNTVAFFGDDPPEIPDYTPDPAKHTEDKDNIRNMTELLKNLPENQRRVISLSGVSGLSNSEIKEVTGFSDENIRVLLSRGRKKLRELFSKT